MAENPSLAVLAGQLRAGVREKKIEKAQSDVELTGKVDEYLANLEGLLSSNTLDTTALRFWLDSSALVLGKSLSKEQLSTPEGESIAIGIKNLTDIEREIAECNDVLRESAEIAGMSVDALLADQTNDIGRQIVALRSEKAEEVLALRAALQAYGLGLVRAMQEGNQKKKAMTQEDLARWQAKFAAPEVLPTDYRSFTVQMQQDFIAAKQKIGKDTPWNPDLVESTERDVAVREFVWGEYAKYIVGVLNRELPGDANEEKRRWLLSDLLSVTSSQSIEIDSGMSNGMLVKEDLIQALPEAAIVDIARHTVIADLLATLRLPLRYEQNASAANQASQRYADAYAKCLSLLEAIDNKTTWKQSNVPGKRYIRGSASSAQNLPQERAKREIALANQIDGVVKFLYSGLDEKTKLEMLGGVRYGYQALSPVRRVSSWGRTPTFASAIPAETTPDGIFYSPLSVSAESRVTMDQATRDARAFEQGLANALNKGKLSHDWVAESPSDVAMRNASRIAAAEQQVLTATDGERRAVEAERALEEAREEIARLREQLLAATATATEKTTQLEQRNRELVAAKAATVKAEGEKAGLIRENTTLEGERAAAEERAAAAEGKTNSILELLREPAEHPEMLGGNLKKVVARILEDSKQKSKK